jgi:23S rRNA (guanosine2251-2'-O)-methyltransferase
VSKPSREFLYGLNPAFEALRSAQRTVYLAHVNEQIRENGRIKKLLQMCEQRSIPIDYCDKGRLHQLCGSSEHQGIVLKTNTYPYVSSENLLDTEKRVLLLDNVEDPHNVGAILRSAEVFGFQSILIPTKGVPEIYPSVVKVSAGATEHQKIARDRSANDYMMAAKNKFGFKILSLDGKGKTLIQDLPDLSAEKVMLVIGGEDKSVGQFILNESHFTVKVEQLGSVNSLNASVAAGIALFALSLQGVK